MKISVLDHGYVELVETWGVGKDGRDLRVESDYDHNYAVDDCDWEVGIIEAARQSTQGSFRGWEAVECNCKWMTSAPWCNYVHEDFCSYNPGDNKLLTRLYTHNHATPFEFAGMVIEVQAPIMVFREWHRHRTQSYNEASARYAPLPDLYYVPTKERYFLNQGTTNKQAAGSKPLTDFDEVCFTAALTKLYQEAEVIYQEALKCGIPKELARLVMPVGHYSKMRAAANLRNWLGFMTLRSDHAAQWEIRQFANAVAQLVEAKFPKTFALWKAEQ